MASVRILTAGVFVLIFSQAISASTAAEFDNHDDMLPNSEEQFGATSCSGASPTLGDGCTISDDCSTITCKMDFVDKPITFTLKVNKCDEPVTVTAFMDVPDLDITWSHTYTSDDIIAVPGFTASLPSVFSAGVYVQIVDLTNNGDNLNLKVNLLAGGEVLGESVYPVKVTVIEGNLPISTDDCGFFAWWYELDLPAKVVLIAGPIVFLLSICCCCCCYCWRRSRSSNRGTVIVTPGIGPTAVMATTTKSTVPMRPLVEEE